MKLSLPDSGKLEKQQILTMNGVCTAHIAQTGGDLRLVLGKYIFYAIGTAAYHQIAVQIKAGVEKQIGGY